MAPPTPIALTPEQELSLRDACRSQWVSNVVTCFADLPFTGAKLQIHSDGEFPSKTRYTRLKRNRDGNENHFQGCHRLPGAPYLVFSGGDWRDKHSHLFVAHLKSRGRRKRWKSNIEDGKPPESDRVVQRVDLATPMWHAGGIDICGHVVAVPVECGPVFGATARGVKPPKCKPLRSAILFFYLRRPRQPKLVSRIDRSGRKATAVGLTHVPGRRYVAAVLSADKPTETLRGKRLDFYQTTGNTISAGFVHVTTYRPPKSLKWASYQTINFVRETSGQIYLVGLAQGLADLFKVTLPSPPNAATRTRPKLEFVDRKRFEQDAWFAEFKAGVGVHAHDDAISLYAVAQWRRADGLLGLTEYAPV